MQMTRRQNELILRDEPGCFWVFGFFFVVVGGLVMLAGLSTVEPYPVWQRVLAFGMAVAAMGIGGYVIASSPGSEVEADAAARTLVIRRRGLYLRELERFSFGEIRDIYLVETQDIDGDPVHSIRLRLAGGREVPVTSLWLHNKPKLEDNVAQLREFVTTAR
jgi:hypothetical protein